MTSDDVKLSAVRQALQDMPREFRTKDVSNHEVMTIAHKVWLTDSQYHKSVGQSLSYHSVALKLRLVSQANGNKRGALWHRMAEANSTE